MRKLLPFLLLVSAFPLSAQAPYLVKDINPDHASQPVSSSPAFFTSFKNRIYFSATTAAAGTELWSTDGTSGTAAMLLDIIPGAGSSGVAALIVLNDLLLFTARDVDHGIELWVTDGTAAGTHLLTDINPGPNSSLPSAMFVYQNKMFFSVDDGTHGRELWITDGTAAGTRLVKDINPGSASSSPGSFFAFGNSVYFAAANALWKTDGTDAGTVQVANVRARRLLGVGAQLFFEGFTDAAGWELWVSDGTSAGTRMVADIFPGTSSSLDSPYDTGLTPLGNGVIFPATDGTHGREIWVSDGTETGTHMVRDFVPGPVGMYDTGSPYLTQFAGRVFFGSFDADHGNEVWSTDGTDAGTSLFYDAYPGAASSSVFNLRVAGTKLFWLANRTSTLWVTDGTTAGTHAIRESDGLLSAGPGAPMQAIDGKLYFAGSTSLNGTEPWVSDGTDAGTRLLANVAPDTVPSSSPIKLTAVGNQLFFIASSAPSPTGFLSPMLWRSDGTAAGTIPLTAASYGSTLLLPAGSQLLMLTSLADWTQSDGTVSGTKPAKELLSRFSLLGDAFVFQLYPFGDRLYAPVHVNSNDTILWKTAIEPNAPAVSLGLRNVGSMIDVAGRQYAIGDTGLSTTDGTPAGTYAVFPPFGSFGSHSGVGQFASAAGTIYLLQNPGSANATLWKSDGTFDGTSAVKTLSSPYPYSPLTASGRRVYFVNGTSLWTSDGTADGTVALADLNFGTSLVSNYVVYPASGDRVVFFQNDPVAGGQMWGTDGTPAGTKLLMTLGSVYPNPASIDGQVWFNGVDTAHGSELWVTDGTTAGTRMVADINPGAASSTPSSFAKMGNVLYFNAYRDDVGAELWALPLTETLLNISDTRVAEGNSGNVVAHFNVTLSAAATQTVSVQYATSDGTAQAGQDYDAASGTLTFAPGETAKSIDVNVHGDSNIEGNETFFVTLQNPTGGARVVRPAGTGIIDDDDQKVDVSLEHVVDLSFDNLVNVKNSGPSGATDVSVVFRSTPMLYSCPPCIAEVPALASGTSAQVGPYPIASGPSYASATASSHQPDVQPANNQISWCSASGISMESAYLTPGVQGTITALVTSAHPAAASSDPSVVTVSAPILSSDGTRVTVTASAVKPGSATITVGSAALRVLVSAAGTLPRWPGGVSVRLDLSSVSFDQPAQLFVRPDGTAPFSGAMATGTVTLSGQGQQITKGLTSQVTYSFYPPSLGTFSYQVDYSGDATFEPQTQKVTVFVSKGRATLRALLEPIVGQPGSFSLKVGAAGSPVAPPSGTLSIRNGSTEIATLTLSTTSSGDAAAQTVLTNLPASPTLTIVYAGDPLYDSTTTSVRALQPHRRAVRH